MLGLGRYVAPRPWGPKPVPIMPEAAYHPMVPWPDRGRRLELGLDALVINTFNASAWTWVRVPALTAASNCAVWAASVASTIFVRSTFFSLASWARLLPAARASYGSWLVIPSELAITSCSTPGSYARACGWSEAAADHPVAVAKTGSRRAGRRRCLGADARHHETSNVPALRRWQRRAQPLRQIGHEPVVV